MKISIVVPVYNEEQNINPFYEKVVSSLKNSVAKDYELIFVDDGSKDNSFNLLAKLVSKDKRVRVVKLRKNFGQTAAMNAGFQEAKNPIIVTLDADLQNDPSDIPLLLSKLNEGYDVVSGWRWQRKDPLSKKLFSKIAFFLRRFMTKDKIHDSGCTLKAYKADALKGLNLYGEAHRFIPTLLAWKGYKVGEVKVSHHQRKFGKTKYSSSRIFRGFLDLLTLKFWQDYSTRPLHFFARIGIINLILGIIIVLYNPGKYGLDFNNIGPTLLAAALFILIGVQFFGLGFIAEIQIRIYYSHNKNYEVEKVLKK